MKKIVFICILFFIFVFQTKAQRLSPVLRHNDRGIFVADHARPINYSNNYSATAHKSYPQKDSISNYSYEDYLNAAIYIDAVYKTLNSNKTTDSPKQIQVIPAADAKRIEFSDNK
ncbi:MAG TPA: hypothetical protein VN698_06210 [Bacteroidia bacterium]|nr:hypothetical protein [Bacteroidia bacterium]